MADNVLWLAGLGLILAGIYLWLLRGRRDPLGNAPSRPNRLLPEHVLALMLAFAAASMMAEWAVGRIAGGRNLKMTVHNAVQVLGGIACLALGAKLFDGGLRRFLLGRGRSFQRAAQGVLLFVASLTVCSVVYTATEPLFRLLHPHGELPQHTVIEALRGGTEPAWILRLGAVLIAPVAEECFFRGLVQTVLRNMLGKPWPAVVITGLMFGLAHSQQPQVVPTLAALGILAGASYERSGSLVAPVVLHALFNLKTLSWEALGA